MKRNTLIGTTTAALLATSLFAGVAAYADNDASEIAAFQAATVNIHDAIKSVEEQTGGKALSGEFDEGDRNAVAGYEVEILTTDGTLSKFLVDGASGAITADNDSDDDHDNDDKAEDVAEIAAFQAATINIHDAISAVEAKTGGTGISASFDDDTDNNAAGYEIEILMADGTVTEWIAGAQSAEVTQDSDD